MGEENKKKKLEWKQGVVNLLPPENFSHTNFSAFAFLCSHAFGSIFHVNIKTCGELFFQTYVRFYTPYP